MRCRIYSLYVPFRSFSHNQVSFSHTLLDFLRQFIDFFKYLNTKIIIPKRKHTPFNTFISTSTRFQCITSHLKHLFFSPFNSLFEKPYIRRFVSVRQSVVLAELLLILQTNNNNTHLSLSSVPSHHVLLSDFSPVRRMKDQMLWRSL